MSKDIECPYCGEWQEIIHDDGYGYEEETLHNQQCRNCDKVFGYTTSISFYYEARKVKCLNTNKDVHKWKPTTTNPYFYTKMRCLYCEEERAPTEEERKLYGIPTYEEYLAELDKLKKQ